DLHHPPVVGEQTVDLPLDVVRLGVDGRGQPALDLAPPYLGGHPNVPVGQLLRGAGHLVGEPAAEPHVAGHPQTQAAELTVDDRPAVEGKRVAGADVGVVVVDVAAARVGQRGAAVLAAVRVDQPARVPRLDRVGDAPGVVLTPAFVERYPHDDRRVAAALVDHRVQLVLERGPVGG